jgi:two-component system KDP operon response regulator KdpE
MTRLLVVDDEQPFLRALAISLRAQDYEVLVAGSGEQALAMAADEHPDLVVLDLGLPSMDGLEVLRQLRTWSALPVLVLSARSDVADAIAALDAGADDFLAKPFAIGELQARIRAQLRRSVAGRTTEVDADDFHLDLGTRIATVDGSEVHLTPTEWRLLDVLIRNDGLVVSQHDLLSEVWGPRYVDEHDYVRVFVATLRRKLEPDPACPRHLLTCRGLGYRFVRDAELAPTSSESP